MPQPEEEGSSLGPFDLSTSDIPESFKNAADPNASAQANLEGSIEGLKRQINEERFIFAIVVAVLFDAFNFRLMDNWGSSIAILFLEVLALIVLSRRFGISDLVVFIQNIINFGKKP